jgi:NTP pyrophosphatase (non-canonical NTP hydrolase)
MITPKQLQSRNATWARKNFPCALAHEPLLGIIEEFAELKIATDKLKAKDAIADIVVFMAHYCNLNNIELEVIVDCSSGVQDVNINPLVHLGKLCHFHLKGEQGIRYNVISIQENKEHELMKIYRHVLHAASWINVDVWQAVSDVWPEVEKRDWTKKNGTVS